MGWIVMSLRRSELQRKISDHTYEKLTLSRQLNQLSAYASAISDGVVTPVEIATLGSDLFGQALDFSAYANQTASEWANTKTDYYDTMYGDVTRDQYYNNSSLAAQAELYFDPETGSLDRAAMYSKFYDEILKEYANDYIMPILNEQEKDIQDRMSELDALVESEQAELEQLKNGISSDIQNNSIKLS